MEQARWSPAAYPVYKPSRDGTGRAMKLDLRLTPKWVETEAGGYWERVKEGQGLFLEIAPQEGKNAEGFATFGWNGPGLRRVKLGAVDVQRILVSYREVREKNKAVPAAFRGKDGGPTQVQLYHRHGSTGTLIRYTFEQTRSIIEISRSKDDKLSIVLDLAEEFGFATYLQQALIRFQQIGVR